MSKWPEGVPLPPKPEKPDGLTDVEWEIYQNCDPQKIDPRIREKVETAMGWKPEDTAAAQEIAEKVLGAVSVAFAKGHIPPENLDRYRSIRNIVQALDSLGGHVSGMGQYEDANKLWAMKTKYARMANGLRADIPGKEDKNDDHD